MSIDAADVAAVVVTRGDVDLDPVVDSLVPFFGSVVVYDNSAQEDLGVYGRYAQLPLLLAPVIYVQDDDCVLPPASIQALLDNYEPGMLVANLPAKFHERYKDRGTCLVGFGAIFQRDLPNIAFSRFALSSAENANAVLEGERSGDTLFARTCDLVFAGLTPHKTLDLPYEDLPWARDDSRMWRQSGHFEERLEMMNLVRSVRDGVTA